MRFAGKPCIRSMIMANKNDNGMTDATMSDVRQLKRNMKTTSDTNKIPSSRLRRTVCTVAFTRLVRSRKGSILTLSGRIRSLSSAIFSFRWTITSLGFCPRNIITIPCTTSSSSFRPTCPKRGLEDIPTSATCFTRIGELPFTSMSIFSISSILSSKPIPLTTNAWLPFCITSPPTFILLRSTASYTSKGERL